MKVPYRQVTWCAAFGLMLATSCAHSASGTFTGASFHQARYGYDVRYQDPANLGVLSPEWRLDNFYVVGGKLKPKTEFETQFGFDLDGDGKADKTEVLPSCDLRLEHLRTAGIIWLRSIPVATYDGGRDLRVLMQDYVESMAGAGYEVAQIGPTITIFQKKRFATQIVDQRPATVAGHEGWSTTVDVASVDQLQMSHDARGKRVKLVLVRANLLHAEPGQGFQTVQFPVFLLAGYANQPEFFEQNLGDFNGFLGQVILGGYMGYSEQPGPPVGAAMASGPPGPGAPGPGTPGSPGPGAPAAFAPPTGSESTPSGAPATGSAGLPEPIAPGVSANAASTSAIGASSAAKKPASSRKGKKSGR